MVVGGTGLTCSASVATRHVEAILRMRGVGVRISRDLDTSGRRLVGLSEMEAALKGALVLWEGRGDVEKQRRRTETRLDPLPLGLRPIVPAEPPRGCDTAISVPPPTPPAPRRSSPSSQFAFAIDRRSRDNGREAFPGALLRNSPDRSMVRETSAC